MDIQAERLDLIAWLIEQDETILKKIKQLRKKSMAAATSPNRMTMEEYIVRIEESEKAIKEGRVISAEDLDEEMKNW